MELSTKQPGAFQIVLGSGGSGWYFFCNCPCGCPYMDCVPLELIGETMRADFEKRVPGFKYWDWDGDLERPTISPSFKRNTPCKIHFNVEKGRYTIHPDGAPAAPDCYRAPD